MKDMSTKYSWLPFIRRITRKIVLVTTVFLLVFSTTSCADTQTNSSPVESAATPTKVPNSSLTQELPPDVQSAVLNYAAKRMSKTVAALSITEAQKQSWGDSCLGLSEPEEVCAQVIVPGWKVVVSDGQQELVYRTDESGKQVRLEDLQT